LVGDLFGRTQRQTYLPISGAATATRPSPTTITNNTMGNIGKIEVLRILEKMMAKFFRAESSSGCQKGRQWEIGVKI
jgi:hypothetical protein